MKTSACTSNPVSATDTILLAGNPNSGKTTVFNSLTGANLRTGNYHGVTTTATEGTFLYNGSAYTVVDLPGTYSLLSKNGEEAVASEAVNKNNAFVLIVIEAACLASALTLANEVISQNKRCAAVINMYDELVRKGGKLNSELLGKYLGIPVFINKKGNDLKKFIAQAVEDAKTENSPITREKEGVITLNDLFSPPKTQPFTKADKLLTGAVTGVLTALLIIAFSLYSAFGRYSVGTLGGEILNKLFSLFLSGISKLLKTIGAPRPVESFITEGLLSGIAGVLGFIPQLAVLYICSVVIEQSGYLARLSYLFDGTLKKFGLSGRAVFPFLVGFGCTAQATLTANSMETSVGKRSLLLTLGFIPCSARLPVVCWLISVFFPKQKFLIILSVYVFGVAFGLLFSFAYSERSPVLTNVFVFELPPLRIPSFEVCAKQLNFLLKTFIIKAIAVLSAVSAALWFARSFGFGLEYLEADRISESFLASFGGFISFIFLPMGFTGWQMPVIAMSGLIAKEGMLSAIYLVGGEAFAANVSASAALSLIVFSSFYTPCVISLSAVKQQTNSRFCAIYGVFTFMNGLLFGYITNFLSHIVLSFGLYSLLIAPAVFILFVLLYSQAFRLAERLKQKILNKPKKKKISANVQNRFAYEREACKTYMCAGCPVRCCHEIAPRKGREGKRQTPK